MSAICRFTYALLLSGSSDAASVPTTLGGIALGRKSLPLISGAGLPQSGRIYVTNNTPRTITFAPVLTGPSNFTLTPNTCRSLASLTTCDFEVTFLSSVTGNYSATLALNPSGGPPGQAPAVAITGSVPTPAVTVGRTSLPLTAFVGSNTSGRIYITNTQPFTLNIDPQLSGDASFSVTYDPRYGQNRRCRAIPAFQRCGINVVFTPVRAGKVSGTLKLAFRDADVAPPPPTTIALTGTAQVANVLAVPQALNFLSAGTLSVTKSVQLTNSQTHSVSLAPAITGSTAFALTRNCTVIPAKGKCSIDVTYTASPVLQSYGYLTDAASLRLNWAVAPDGAPDAVPLSSAVWGDSLVTLEFTPPVINTQQRSVPVKTNLGTFTVVNMLIKNYFPNEVSVGLIAPGLDQTQGCSTVPAFGTCNVEYEFAPSSLGSTYIHIQVSAPFNQAFILTHDGPNQSLFSDGKFEGVGITPAVPN